MADRDPLMVVLRSPDAAPASCSAAVEVAIEVSGKQVGAAIGLAALGAAASTNDAAFWLMAAALVAAATLSLALPGPQLRDA